MKLLNLAFFASLLLSPTAIAQTPPPQEITPPTLPFPSLPEPQPPQELQIPPFDLPPLPSQPLPPSPDAPGTITVERFNFTGNSAFSSEQLAEVTAPFTGRPITFNELLQARSAVTQFYVSNGYITSGALIPPQPLGDGTVTIQVVEGSLEEIQVRGTQRLNPQYVRSRLNLAAQPALNVNRLLEALQLLQLDPLIDTLSAELTAGTRPNTSILIVQVNPAPTLSSQLSVDNQRSPSVGTVRSRANLTQANLLGFGDRLSLEYIHTEGSHNGNLSYTVPINPRNGTLNLNYNRTHNNIIEEPFNILDIQSVSSDLNLTLRQPLLQTPTQEFALGLTASRRLSKTSLLDTDFPLSPGADEQGRTAISALRFSQEWTERGQQQVFAVRSQFSLGLGILDATLNSEPPDSRFFAWRGQMQYVRQLAPDTLLLLRSDLQLASVSLLPLEQFGLGGVNTVRGYRQDALLADNGALVSAEIRVPLLRSERLNGVLQIVPFIDAGRVWNSSGQTNPDPNTLIGVGVGLRIAQGNNFTARLDWGIPLISLENTPKTWQENGLYFSVQWNPF